MQNKRMILAILIFALLAIGVAFMFKQKNGGFNTGQMPTIEVKSYTQGQWDGVNVAIQYLQKTHQIDSVRLDIHVVDSMLTIKEKQ